MKTKYLIIALLIFFTTFSLRAQNEEISQQLDSYFKNYVFNKDAKGNTPGVSIVITNKDSVVIVKHYGTADLENNIQISDNTIFDLASVSKQFTGMAIAILEEEGKISSTDKIIQYIPDLPEVMNDITIAHLVHHTSGIRDWPLLFMIKGSKVEDEISFDQIIEFLKKQEGLNFEPGSEYLYSNSNYNLLVKVIETVTDSSFNSWMNTNIFLPLGMDNTYILDSCNHKIENKANAYSNSRENYNIISNKLNAHGSSSLHTNITDMSKWMISLYTKIADGDLIITRMLEQTNLNDGSIVDYGYGFEAIEINGQSAYFHDGAWAGYKSGTFFSPNNDIGIVVLSNDDAFQPKEAIREILNIVSPQNSIIDEKETPELSINDDFFKLCAGKYEQVYDKGFFLTFFKEGEEYFVDVNGHTLKLYASSDTVLYVKEVEAEFIFHLENGEVNSHSLHQNGKYHKALKVDEKKTEKKTKLKKLNGKYYSKELDITFEIIYKYDQVRLFIDAFPIYFILNQEDGLAFSEQRGVFSSVTFIVEKKKTTGLLINTARAKNMYFEKIK